MEVMTDNLRRADIDNPHGYYEFEPVKRIREDPSWLPDTRGKTVKMVARLLYHLPPDFGYQVVFMKRDLREMLRSQARMLERLGKAGGTADDGKMATLFHKELENVERWLAGQSNLSVLYVEYGDVVAHPAEGAARVNAFIAQPLDVRAMAAAVDPALYRNR